MSQRLQEVSGLVRNASTKDALPFASVRVEGSTKGTTTDKHGRFTLYLEPGSHTLVASYIGYTSAQRILRIDRERVDATLELSPGHIDFPAVTVTPGDNPALRIIRQAIESKERRKKRLENYRLTSHSKLVVRASDIKGVRVNNMTDSAFTAVMETQTDAWWAKPNRSKEIVKARKQTAFIPAQSNIIISSFFIIDFSNDLLKLSDKAPIVGPISEAGLRNYDYTLAGTTVLDGEKLFRIEIRPLSENDPLLVGSLTIADGTYALTSVDVTLNDAAMPTFFKRLRFQQHFRLFEKEFWMPTDVVVDADVEVSMIVSVKLAMEGFSVLQDYAINEEINEEFFDRTRIKVLKEADERDSLYWSGNQKIPNTAEELDAYRKSDSVKAVMEAGRNEVDYTNIFFGKTFQNDDTRWTVPGLFSLYRFNRVEGHVLSPSFDIRNPFAPVEAMDVEAGYGFSDMRWSYAAGVRVRIQQSPGISLAARIFDRLGHIDEGRDALNTIGTTIASLFAKFDEKDYYRVKGGQASFTTDVLYLFPSTVTVSRNSYLSAAKHTDWSIARRSWDFRENPSVNDGVITSLQVTTGFDDRDFIDNAGTIRRFGGRSVVPTVAVAYNAADIAGEQFTFTQLTAGLNGTIPFGRFGALRFQLSGSTTEGKLPTQRLLNLPGSVNHIVDRWRFRTLGLREFGGDQRVMAMVEHDFGDQVFRWLHVPLLESSGWSLVLFGNAGWSAMRDATRGMQTVATGEARVPIYEAGVALDRIFLLFRLEAAWRLNHFREGRNFFIGISTPFLF